MNSDEEDSGISGQDRAPGKLDRNVINNLVQLSEENYSKSPTKGSCYAPTALLEAKKREVENPAEEQQNFGFDSVIYGCMPFLLHSMMFFQIILQYFMFEYDQYLSYQSYTFLSQNNMLIV